MSFSHFILWITLYVSQWINNDKVNNNKLDLKSWQPNEIRHFTKASGTAVLTLSPVFFCFLKSGNNYILCVVLFAQTNRKIRFIFPLFLEYDYYILSIRFSFDVHHFKQDNVGRWKCYDKNKMMILTES